MNSDVFKPIRGAEATILATTPQKGYVYFATDTRKIFYSDGESFLSMGGNSGIYYGSLTFEEPPDSDITDFTFTLNEIEGDHAPNEDDLILNIPDGCFYRVNSVEQMDDETYIQTTKLTIAGSGSGGGGTMGITLKVKNNLNSATIYCVDEQDAIVSFNVTSSATDDSIAQIIYRIGSSGSIATIVDEDGHDLGDIEFNLKPYVSSLSTATSTTLTITIIDVYGVQKTLTYILNRVSISLKEDSNLSTILQAQNHELYYECTPIGGGNLLNKKLIYTIYDNNRNLLTTQEKTFVSTGTTQSITIDLETIDNIGIGTYYIEIKYIGYTTATATIPVESNILSHSIISYGDEPLLVAYLSQETIEQYSNLYISYMIGTSNTALLDTNITLTKNDNSQVQSIKYNTLYSWKIYLDTPGIYDFSLQSEQGQIVNFKDFVVTEYEGNIPIIDNSLGSLKLNLTTTNRNNNEVNRNVWTDRNFETIFENFVWEELNGWIQDEEETDILRLSSGAKITINNPTNSFFTNDAMNSTGYTIELDFKISGVTDFSQPLISCVSKYTAGDNIGQIKVGFQITGQTSTLNTSSIQTATGEIIENVGDDNTIQEYNTQIQGLTTKFIENERIHLSWVIGKNTSNHPMIKTYLNGILSGITEYDSSDDMRENPSDVAKLIIDSTYGIIDIYNIRVYTTDLDARTILENYIATISDIDEKVAKYNDNFGLLDTENNISTTSIEGGSYSLNIPYIKFTGGQGLTKDDNGYKLNIEDSTSHLPRAKKDYRLVETFDFIDPTGVHQDRHLVSSFKDGYLNGITIYGQGTSSMEYPIKNLRVKFKMKDENGKKVKFQVNSNDYPVDILTLKADYMESSSSHNTGTANLIFDLLEANNLHTPGQDYYNAKNPDYKTLTAIRGYPIICFFRENENQPYEYIGRYNLNIDKSSEEVFGFLPEPEEAPAAVSSSTFGWKNAVDTYTRSSDSIVNSIHCYEFLNNASALDNFLNPSSTATFEENFYKLDDDGIPEWYKSFESRYPEGEAKDGSDVDITAWFELCKWVNSTAVTEVQNPPVVLNQPVTYENIEYTTDNEEYRLAKFKNEFEDHFNLNFVTFYYVLTHTLLMIDSRAKNMMMATWDNQHWYPIFYDMDTMLGLNNYGYNKYDYNVEDTAPNVYNGQNSVLWNNFRQCFQLQIRTMYNNLQKSSLNYNGLLRNYNTVQADAWNEMLYNTDAQYKYIDPFIKGYYDGLSGSAEWVNAGTKNYLYASQGSRSMHRKYWIQNRLNYLNGKYLSDLYKDDKFIMRSYTPDAEEDNYYSVENVTAEMFAENTYYIYNNNSYELATSYSANTQYYEKADNKLNLSVLSVPPNNDFTLTPLYNQYLSVAFGGDNGVTSGPYYVTANTERRIEAPSGSKYNDTETYVYGGSMLKDLGDLSTQYLGSFVFPSKVTKLEKLILGNLNKNYYNPNFSSLSIGESAPYLKELNIANCSGLKTVLDLSKCQNLNKIFATGSQLRNISFADHGVLSEVRLPSSIQRLILKDQPYLTTEKFTIGTYDFDNSIYNTSNFSNLNYIYIEDVPQLNTYPIALQSANNESLQDFAFININWVIPNNSIDIDYSTNNTLTVLEKILRKNNENSYLLRPLINNSFANSLTGTIKLPLLNNSTQSNANGYLNIYNKYISVFPRLNFDFQMSTWIHWIKIYDGNNKLYWSLPVKHATNSSNALNSIYGVYHNEGQTAGNLGYENFQIPTKASTPEYKYTFSGKWLVNDEEKTSLENIEITSDLEIYPIYDQEIMQYQVIFYNGNDEIASGYYDYGTKINEILPTTIPHKNDDDLNIYQTYTFLGYNNSSLQTTPLNFTDSQIVNSTKTFYAIFSDIISVNSSENVRYDNFNFILFNYTDPENNSLNETGYQVSPKSDLNLTGKITIPKEYNGLKVLSIANFGNRTNPSRRQNNITGIFFEEGTNIRTFANDAFADMDSLKYLEIPDSLRVVGDYAVYGVQLKLLNKDQLKTDTIYYIGSNTSNLYSLGQYSFTNCIDKDCTILNITSSIQKVSSQQSAILNFNEARNLTTINIGNPNQGSQLILQNGYKPIHMNPKATSYPPLRAINIYLSAENYHNFGDEDKNWLFPYDNITTDFSVNAIQTNI